MHIFGVEITLWRIIFSLTLICIAAWHLLPMQREGFEPGKRKIDPLIACPAIQRNIDSHKEYLEEYTAKSALIGVSRTNHALELFTNSYKENDCETILKNMPAKKEAEAEAEVKS